jgi:hypothetical protein
MRRTLPVLCALFAHGVSTAAAQSRIRGIVVDSATGAPLDQVLVRGPTGSVTSDRFGRFVLAVNGFPARLLISRIGTRPLAIQFDASVDTLVRFPLAAIPIRVADLVVAGHEASATDLGRWSIPVNGDALLPAVGRDLFRDLLAAPAVTQSTLVSARPLIRGYDPGEATIRLDGFDLPDPYHIARAFSAIPVDGVDRVSVATAPLDVGIGATSGAAVDISGRSAPPAGSTGGIALDPLSISGWLGGAPGGTPLFGVARSATVSTVAKVAGVRLPYTVQDGYGSILLQRHGTPWLRGTLFASRDLVNDDASTDAMHWGVRAAGVRADVWRRGAARLELTGFATSFDEVIDRFELQGSLVDVRNTFSRTGGGAEWSVTDADRRLILGATVADRRLANHVNVLRGGLLSANVEDARLETGIYGSWSSSVGRGGVTLGARYDQAGNVSALQPRVHLSFRLGAGWTLGAAAGRSARLYHAVSDPRGIPELVFYDLWYVAGAGGIPVAKVDHVVLSADWARGVWSFRAAAYGSRGTGMVEVRPETDQTASPSGLRFGDSRTRGIELQGGLGGADRSVTLSYALTWSERRWDATWVPWVQDRRHLVRLASQLGIGKGWHLVAMAEGMSAAPLTPVAQVILVQPEAGGPIQPGYIYGPENSARGAGTFRIDAGLERRFRGPWGSRGTLTASVTNLNFGPVAPLKPEDAADLRYSVSAPSGPIQYQRRFDLPAIPTLGLRFEF